VSTAPPPAPKPARPPNPELHTRPTTPSMRSVHLPRPEGAATAEPVAAPTPPVAPAAPSVISSPPSHAVAPAPELGSQAPLARPAEASEGFVLDRRAQFALSETPAPVNPTAQGAENYEQAQAFIKSGELDKAESRLKQASVYDPENADYVALHGYVLGLRAENRGRVPTELAIEKLDKALRMKPGLTQAHFHRAQLHERLGREEEALTDLRKVVELDSSHVEAQREIRMIEVRKQKKAEEEKSGGLLGKLFGKSAPPKR
jgi:tetratricopeptide (TPR) repeat protein